MQPKKIVLFGNSEAAINALRALQKQASWRIRVVIPSIATLHDWHGSMLDYLKRHPVEKLYNVDDINNRFFIEEMHDYQPDVFLFVYYWPNLNAKLLASVRNTCVYIHAALLPNYVCQSPLIQALINGEQQTGVSFFQLDNNDYHGRVILQKRIAIKQSDTGFSLHMKAAHAIKEMLPAFFNYLNTGPSSHLATIKLTVKPLHQLNLKSDNEPAMPAKVKNITLALSNKLTEFSYSQEIDWNNSSQQIDNSIRALTKPLAGAYSYFQDEKLYIWAANLFTADTLDDQILRYPPASIIIYANNRLLVRTADGFIELLQLGLAGIYFKAEEFIKRYCQQQSLLKFNNAKLNSDANANNLLPGMAFMPFGVPLISNDEIDEVVDTLESAWIGMGNKTMLFENQFREYTGAEFAVSVSSCTAALHLALWANGIGRGDEVITTSMTFAATISAILMAGAKPVLVDIDPNSINIDTQAIRQAINSRTRAIMPVHFAGLPCNMAEINVIAQKFNLIVIEDAAHAVGAKYQNRAIGDGANIACFSFYANKNMTTGDGGMITTNDQDLADRLRVMRLHGLQGHAWKRYLSKEIMLSHVISAGYKYNLTDLQAAIGIHQLKKLDAWLEIRKQYARIFDQAFAALPGIRLQQRAQKNSLHAWHLYVLILDPQVLGVERNRVLADLRERNIGAAVHYPAINQHPYFQKTLQLKIGDYPCAEAVADNILSLPMTPAMSHAQIEYIVEQVCALHEQYMQDFKPASKLA